MINETIATDIVELPPDLLIVIERMSQMSGILFGTLLFNTLLLVGFFLLFMIVGFFALRSAEKKKNRGQME